ncbi:MAG: choice-of-anchor J domain-containing protein [Puniceicoccaceae bacterium]
MKINPRYLSFIGCLTALASSTVFGLQINEIRQDEPGGTDSNEFFEIKGTPGESLDNHWYLVIGDHSSFQNPNGDNVPDKGAATVEFALDLTGYVIPDDGHLLISTVDIQFEALGITALDIDDTVDINFENSDNVTHILCTGYTGIEVLDLASQYDDLAVDIDDDNDGILNHVDDFDDINMVAVTPRPLPWTLVVDAVGLVEVPNDSNPEEFVYGAALGFEDVGPDGSFTPGMIYRGSDDNEWNIGEFNLLNDEGTGLFMGDDFNGPALDTPGSANPASPAAAVDLFSFGPTIAYPGDTVRISGADLDVVTSVQVGGVNVDFTIVSASSITFTVDATTSNGVIDIGSAGSGNDVSVSSLFVVTPNLATVYYEDFEVDLGDFTTVSLASDRDWNHNTFGGNGFADINGFSADVASDDYLISPAIDLAGTTEPTLLFNTAKNFDGPDIDVWISTNFDGVNPALAEWTPLAATLSADDYDIIPSGMIDLSTYIGQTVHVAFRYLSAGTGPGEAPVWQVHDFLVYDVPPATGVFLFEDFEVDLGDFTAVSLASNRDWEWGEFSGNGYAAANGFGGDTASDDWLISPQVSLATAIDPKMVYQTARNFGGPELEVLISTDYDGLNPATATWTALGGALSQGDYELVDSGIIDLSAYIGEAVYVAFHYISTGTGGGDGAVYQVHEVSIYDDVIFFEDFEVDLGDFSAVSLASNRDWTWGEFSGNGYAAANGFGGDTASDDWLISPDIDLSGTANPELTYQTARNFGGPPLEVLVSTNYDGLNPATATWNAVGGALSQGDYELVDSGEIDLSAYVDQTINLAFHYVSTGTGGGDGAVYQVHEVLISEFDSGWVDNVNLSFLYRYTPGWSYSITMGFVYTAGYPYIYSPNFGYFYFSGDDIRAGSWIYHYSAGKWAWLVESNGGFFIYFDGTFNNFLDPQP